MIDIANGKVLLELPEDLNDNWNQVHGNRWFARRPLNGESGWINKVVEWLGFFNPIRAEYIRIVDLQSQRECFSRHFRFWPEPDPLNLNEYVWLSADGRHAAVGYPLGDEQRTYVVESFDLKQRPWPAIIGIPMWLAVFWILVQRIASKRSTKIKA